MPTIYTTHHFLQKLSAQIASVINHHPIISDKLRDLSSVIKRGSFFANAVRTQEPCSTCPLKLTVTDLVGLINALSIKWILVISLILVNSVFI